MRISDGSSGVCSSDLYDYTGGAPDNPQLTNLRDKRVAIVGTGCSAVQAIPHLAEWAKELYVFQRTPSMVNFRGNTATDPEWAESLAPGWQEERINNFEDCLFTPNEWARSEEHTSELQSLIR